MKKVLVIKYGEIALRGKNRGMFENKLILNIRKNVDNLGNFYIVREQGRFILENTEGDIDFEEIIPRVEVVLGVIGIAKGYCVEEKNIDVIRESALEIMKIEHGDEKKTFKVVTKRADKQFHLKSNEISMDVGGYIFENMENMDVDVKNPKTILNIEIRTKVYISTDVIKTLGGLPYGSAGKGILLLSGGIDSPVAGFLMARRGVEIICVYFHSPPYTSERAKQKVKDLAKRLSHFTGGIKLYVVPFTETQLYLYENVPPEKMTILLKRAMLRISEKIAEKEKALGLVVGDSVGQVASQTLQSIHAISSVVDIPIYRPLASYDKQDIINLAIKLKTYEISNRPYEDCCTIFLADHPETKPKKSIIESIDRNLNVGIDELENKAIKNSEIVKY